MVTPERITMAPRTPIAQLPTHQVTNQPPPLENYNLFTSDVALQEAVAREAAPSASPRLEEFGSVLGNEQTIHTGRLANQNPPVLTTFDRYGQRIDEVEFHPSYHHMMKLGREAGITTSAWDSKQPHGHVVHTASQYMLAQIEPGVTCPLCMTYAVIPALRHNPDLAAIWEPKLTAPAYDSRFIPPKEKTSLTMGMAMTEKQGGSDVRSNTTYATQCGENEYELTGHKWFCSAPMSDAFLTLAKTQQGISCFFVPRWKPDQTRNPFWIQRLKDKLGNKSNASSEIEYNQTYAQLVGEEGRGIPTIIEMVHHTRLDCMLAAAGLMRQALTQAIHHTQYRQAFGKKLTEQPLMQNVLADLSLEVEAAVAMTFRIARSYDEASTNPSSKLFSRLAVAIGKYWVNKRIIPMIGEAMECLGGAGYVEESPMPWLYREAPLNGIWEGSGNVICLDVLRTLQRSPESGQLFFDELNKTNGENAHLDKAVDSIQNMLKSQAPDETQARTITELMALSLQGSLLIQHNNGAIANAFCESRLGGHWGHGFGTLRDPSIFKPLLNRASPQRP